MRLGGPIFEKYGNPEKWISIINSLGYTAAYCPVTPETTEETIYEFKVAAKKADIVIAEVGAWSNPISQDEEERKRAIEKCWKALYLADKIGASCCVNISGSRGKKWDGPDEKNFTKETFEMIVYTVRKIIDEIKPQHTFYTLETMPWMYPDSADSYLELIEAIDRKQFAVHFDPVNLICSPKRYFSNRELIKDFIKRLGPLIKSCHAKDVILRENLTVHLDETRPGLGNLSYETFLSEINKVDRDIPLMIEHLTDEREYKLAADYIRSAAKKIGISL